MTENKLYEILEVLTDCFGTSGYEAEAAVASQNILSEYMNTHTDIMGNVIGVLNEEGKIKVLLDAHLDRIGFVIRGIDEKGFLLVDKVGGLDERVLPAMPKTKKATVQGKRNFLKIIAERQARLQAQIDWLHSEQEKYRKLRGET